VDPQANTVSIIRKPIVTGRPTCAKRVLTNRLFAGGAHIHVDFHAAGHFDDLGGFPGHFGSPFSDFGRLRPGAKLLRAQKFASEIFPRLGMLRREKCSGSATFCRYSLALGAFGREPCPDKAVVSAGAAFNPVQATQVEFGDAQIFLQHPYRR
jgi:hypothetical protein